MEPPDKYKEAKDEALRQIGLNVLLFQQVEHMLKFLLGRGSFNGTASELRRLVEGGSRKTDKLSMGQLIEPLIDTHLAPFDPEASPPKATTEIYISITFSFNHTPAERAAFQQQLEDLVAERNSLIHHSLDHFHFDSTEGCSAASTQLDQQRERIALVRTKLADMIKMMTETNVEFVKQLREHRDSKRNVGE